nr:unknown protein [Oryza sativa Japonica Group]
MRWRREGGYSSRCSVLVRTERDYRSYLVIRRFSQDLKRSYVIINRSSAVQDIPAASRALDSQSSRILSLKYIGSHTRSGFLESIWASCHSLFALRGLVGLSAPTQVSVSLLLFILILLIVLTCLASSHQVDKDSLVRKQALYILRISLDIFPSSENDAAQQCSRRRSAALPAQDKPNTAMTKREVGSERG